MIKPYMYVATGLFIASTATMLFGSKLFRTAPINELHSSKIPLRGDSGSGATIASEFSAIREEANIVSNKLEGFRSVISSIASEQTPTPGQNHLNHFQLVQAVRKADRKREQKLRPIVQQIDELGRHLQDLRDSTTKLEDQFLARLSSTVYTPFFPFFDARLDDQKPTVSPENVIGFFGLLCTFGTLFLGVRKDLREAEAAVLTAQRELLIATNAPAEVKVRNS
jgi:hypothetical protein